MEVRAAVIACIFALSLGHSTAFADPSPAYPAGLSVVSEATAEALFQEVAKDPEIPFDYPDGCFAKAEKADQFLEKKGVIAGKAFVEGQIYHLSHWGESYWLFHVAPLILVQGSGAVHPYIIDPFLSDHLLPFEDWIGLLKADPNTTVSQTYFTNRFVYGLSEKSMNLDRYPENDIQDMETVLQQIREYLAGYAGRPSG